MGYLDNDGKRIIDGMNTINKDISVLKSGVSGFMRVKNDAEFVEASIDSCIDALDELVIVYNDCSDNTPELVEKKRLQYPDKIKVFEYKHKVYSVNLSEDEYRHACGLPDDSPHLLCNYYNFALSKVTYKYAVKIDADQLYFPDQLKKWCDLCRTENRHVNYGRYFCGFLFNAYFVLFKLLCFRTGRYYPVLPGWLVRFASGSYLEYIKAMLHNGRACLSLSGINVVKDDKNWYVSLGYENDVINVLPPFNGEGDHLIFKVSGRTYFEKYDMPYYNLLTSGKYSLIENFVHPYKIFCAGFAWFHLNAMRNRNIDKILNVKHMHEQAFVGLMDFIKMGYTEIIRRTDNKMFSLRQKVLFSYLFKSDRQSIENNISMLDRI